MTENNEKNLTITMCDGSPFIGTIILGFEDVIPQMPLEIQNRYEQEILDSGLKLVFPVWKKRNGDSIEFILIANHFEYMVAQKHGLAITINILEFESEENVIRFIITTTMFRTHLNKFQRGEVILKYEKILSAKGKENMRMGGKGYKILEKVDTMVELSAMIDSSHDTLRKIRFIKNTLILKDPRLNMLREGEVSINHVYEELTGKKKNYPKDHTDNKPTPPITEPTESEAGSHKVIERKITTTRSKYHLEETDKFSVIYLNPHFPRTDAISIPDKFRIEINRMNIAEIAYDKFCTLFIQTPSNYLGETIEMISEWGFEIVDSLTVNHSESIYTSKYSDQNHEILLVCEFNGVGVPRNYIVNRPSNSIIRSEEVLDVLGEMFDPTLAKLTVFTEPKKNWVTYNFDKESNQMIKFFQQAG